MNINSICLELPSKLDEIFNFDGLKKIIEFFHNNNSILIDSIKDFNKRIVAFESLKSDIDTIKIKALNIEKNNEEINNSFNNIKEKIIFFDGKINELSKKVEENSQILSKHKYKLDNHEENINKLNFYIKENFENIKEIKENYYAMKKRVDVNNSKLNELSNKNNQTMDLIRGNSGNIDKEKLEFYNHQIESFNANINTINDTINNMKKISEIKYKEYDKSINKIIQNISNPNKEMNSLQSLEFAFMEKPINKEEENKNNEEENYLSRKSLLDFEKEKKKYNEIFEEYKLKEKKLKEENNIFKKEIKEIKENIDKINKKLKDISFETNDLININNDFDYITNDKFKILRDNIKILSVAINTKPNKEDFEALKRNLDLRIKKLEFYTNSIDINKNHLLELKEQKDNSSLLEKKNIEYIIEKIQLTLKDDLTPLIKDLLLKYGKNIDLSNNLVILEINKNNRKNIDDINKKFTSLIEKKSKLIKELDGKYDLINEQVIKINQSNNVNNNKINELIKEIGGSEEEESEENEENRNIYKLIKGGIKERLIRLTQLFYETRDRVVILEKKYSAFSKEVKEDIKNNLKNETTKIVEQFKNKLSSFTYKFEDELRNKIDQIGLYTFEKRINSRILYELKEKLDKHELKKSNIAINRKIDSLENKISKTLVDTIIDLQMDEAPLIAKKNSKNLEICASCNQLLKRNNSINSDGSLSPNKTNMNKFKIKNMKYNGIKTQTTFNKDLSSPKKYLPEINKDK